MTGERDAARLCLDFGTAFCKAAVCAPGRAPKLLRIADAARQGTGSPDGANPADYMLETAIAISASARLYFGGRARAVADGNTRVLQAIKDPLTLAGGPQDLDRLLPRQFNPTSVDVSRRDVIVLYLAFLTQAALGAWFANRRIDRSVVRGVTIPAFEAAKVAWVNAELGTVLAQAEIVGRHFGNRLFTGVPLREALECLVRSRQSEVHRHLIADSTTEPIAAFAARLLHFTPLNQQLGNVIMVVDVGAGTTDFALFASGLKDGRMRVRHIKHSHRSLAVAGNAIDDALVEHALAGAETSNEPNLDAIRTRLEIDKRQLKEVLFRDGATTIVYAGTTVQLSLDEFLASARMQQIIGAIKGAFDAVLQEVLPARRGGRVVVYFSGGGAALPFLKQFVPVSETSFTHRGTGRSGLVRLMEPRDPRPSWHDQAGYESLWRACGGNRQPPNQDFFGRVAVALGGAYFVADARDWLHLDRTMLWPMVTRDAELLRAPRPG